MTLNEIKKTLMEHSKRQLKKTALLFSFLAITCIAFTQSYPDSIIKKNVQKINSPLDRIIRLEPKEFEYDTHNFKQLRLQAGKQYGFMTENMQTVFPSLIIEKPISYMFGKNTYRDVKITTIDESGLIPVLVAAIKEQQAEIEKLKQQLQHFKK